MFTHGKKITRPLIKKELADKKQEDKVVVEKPAVKEEEIKKAGPKVSARKEPVIEPPKPVTRPMKENPKKKFLLEELLEED